MDGASSMSGTDTAIPSDLGDGITTKVMPRVFRHDKPRWEVLQNDIPIGYITAFRIGRSHSNFFSAVGYMPGTGQEIQLENSTDFRERCQTLVEFHRNPWASVHIGWQIH